MRKYSTGIWLILVLNLLWSLLQICIPFLTKALVDSGIENRDKEIVVLILISQILLYIGITIADVYRKWLLRHIGVRVNLLLIVNFLKGIIKKPFTFFNVHEQGNTVQHFNDNLRIEQFLTNNTSDFFNALIKLFIYGLLLFIFSATLGWIFVIFNILLAIWVGLSLETRESVDHHRFAVSAEARTELMELFTGIIDLKAYNQEKNRIDRWDQVQSKFSSLRLNLIRLNQIIFVVINGLAQFRDILIMFYAAWATIDGEMTLGTLLAIQYILGQLNEPVNQLIEFVPQYQDAKLSLERINKAISSEDLESETVFVDEIPNSADIHLEHVTYTYSTKPAVDDVSIEIPYGKSIAILGESGSGKSTLMRLMLKLIRPDKGQIAVGSKALDIISSERWLNQCSVVLQESLLFHRSILYNITFENNIELVDKDRIYYCLEKCQVLDVVQALPQGLFAVVGSDGINFSKGQAQRLLLARALYKDVDYYFLDEPFSALDRITYRKVFRNLREVLENKTLIIVTHRMEVAMKMDHIYLLEEGRLIESGTHERLSQLGKRYNKIFLSDDDE